MFGLPGPQEFMIMVVIIVVLSLTGIWPQVIRGLRELRGDIPPEMEDNSSKGASKSDLEVSCKMLGLSPSAKWDEIEKAYRAKAKIHHPDHGGDQDAMRALNEAYALLKKVHGKR